MEEDDGKCILLGDVGGTNIRLILTTIYLKDKDTKEIIKESNINSQSVASFEDAVNQFLRVRSL